MCKCVLCVCECTYLFILDCIFFGIPYSHVVWWCIVNIMSNYECWISNPAHYHKWEISLLGLRSHVYWSKIMGQFHFLRKKNSNFIQIVLFCFLSQQQIEKKKRNALRDSQRLIFDLCSFLKNSFFPKTWHKCLDKFWSFLLWVYNYYTELKFKLQLQSSQTHASHSKITLYFHYQFVIPIFEDTAVSGIISLKS